ncbi:HD domain-containing protein [Cellulosilyticum sp. I15G10I2]|uniref:HD domain-containing protein n=1 Tax=Cellulosilyticum sp. I15G10I2 TaxID=1892843 RepID=UPI00085CDE72|nr:HD domain-containing protein [Cellulosilyticum sp. I15G10I2]
MFICMDKVKLEMINYFRKDLKRINHALKVHSIARAIAVSQNLDEPTLAIVETASLLHDIGIKEAELKYNSSAGRYQELEGPPIAKTLLQNFDLELLHLNRILHLIGNHHSYSKIDGIDFQILIESDFIVNIEEDCLDKTTILIVKEKYFKTDFGKTLLTQMFL